jgi:hypothetical protein
VNTDNIDERLKFLLTSTESLHASCQELHAQAVQDRLKAEETTKQMEAQRAAYEQMRADLHRHQVAMLAAIRAYLEGGEQN